ncbi:MAG: type topoisomerase gyrase/topo topoisomerase subunit [Clostridia bacterium]|jgi:DNA gyrase subunit A|nr:type topoisomerase gyrase/topo topoisomerase subunit [Clostridia bacterium]
MATKNLLEQRITETLETNYMPYAMSVIISRAIPEIDGFKPSHRKLLYTMYKMGLLTGNRTKSANVVGQTMKLNPHGDMTIYETLVRLTRGNDALLHPFVDSKGNFGKQYSRDMAYAAPRYTEVKLDKICNEIFKDIDKNTVDFVDNYDGTLKEPTLLPTTFPNILVNPNQGIAVGMASNICSFNLEEMCETTIAYLKNENTDITKTLKAPDFSSGGKLIYNEKEINEIYNTGKGSFKLRAKYRYDKSNNCIEIYEIPYTTTTEVIIDKIIDLVKTGKVKDITDIRDETDLNGLKITLDLKRNTDPDKLMSRLFKLTTLQDTFSCNFNILINGAPVVLGVKGILREWTSFRINCIKRQITFDIDKKSDKLHLLKGLKKILLDIDKAIKIIRETEEDAYVIPNLMKGFDIDQTQAEFIAEIKLRNLNKEYILKRTDEIDSLEKELEDLRSTLNDETKIKKVIIKELREIAKKYGQSRRTEIIYEEQMEEITEEHLIDDYNLKIFLTEQSYLKKIPLISLRANADQKLKENDAIIQEIETNNRADLLLFSNKHTVYKLKVHEIADCKASNLGEYLPNLLQLDADEKIIYVVATNDYTGFMLFSFENGKIAKIDLNSYATKTNRKKLANAYSNFARLIHIIYLQEDIELVAFSSINKVLVFNTANISLKTTRDSQGVQVLNSKKGSTMVKVRRVDEVEFEDLDYYRTKNIPATGCYLKPEDRNKDQITLWE